MSTITVTVGRERHDTSRGPLWLDRRLNDATLAMLIAALIEFTDKHGARWGAAQEAIIGEGYVELIRWFDQPSFTFKPDPDMVRRIAEDASPCHHHD